MKKIGLLAVSVLTFSLISCGGDESNQPESTRRIVNPSTGGDETPPAASAFIPMPTGALAFGGIYSNGTRGNTYVNPLTNAASCPDGFTATKILGNETQLSFPTFTDQDVFVCTSTNAAKSQFAAFGGIYTTSPNNGPSIKNPVTDALSCAPGFSAAQFLGSPNDDASYFCYARGEALTTNVNWSFGGAFGKHLNGSNTLTFADYVNPSTTAASCPADFVAFPVVGNLLRDNVMKVCLKAQPGFNLAAPSAEPSMPPAGLKGTYYIGTGPQAPGGTLVGSRVDSMINFGVAPSNAAGSVAFPALNGRTFGSGLNFSVLWTGFIMVPYTTGYTFSAYVDDGFILKINNQTIINAYGPHDHATVSGSVTLEAGRLYPVEISFYNGPGEYAVTFYWAAVAGANTPAIARTVVPASAFYHTAF